MYHCDNVEATGFVEHLKLPHYVDFQSELELLRKLRAGVCEKHNKRERRMNAAAEETRRGYNFAYLDEQTKRMIRRALLKAVAIPGTRSRSQPRNALAVRLGHGRLAGDVRDHRTQRHAEGDRPGLR